MRWPSSAALAIAGLLAGCAFEAGQPWGELDATVEVAFEPAGSRLDDQGRIKTSNSYRVRVDRLQVRIDAVTVRMASGAAGAAAFDPADPPPGYSLCHNGHCHHDSGALVDYADIELELRGVAGGASVTMGVEPAAVSLEVGDRAALPLLPCEGRACDLPRGALGGVEVVLGAMELSVLVSDTRDPDAFRLPEGEAELSLAAGQGLRITAPIDGRIDEEHPVGVGIGATLVVPESLFDGVEWPAAVAATAGRITTNLSEEMTIDASVQRFDP